VKTYPGEAVFAGNQVFIKRLVLMPEDDDAEGGHAENSV
jgi:hypothetical protein